MENEKRLISLDMACSMLNRFFCNAPTHAEKSAILEVKQALLEMATTEVVRCKDCKHRGRKTYCPMYFQEWYEIDEGDGYYDSDFTIHDRTIDEGFCDRGERKNGE